MDQSFSIDNFKIILSNENRKGRNLEKEFFPPMYELTLLISELNKKIKKRKSLKITDDPELRSLIEEQQAQKVLKKALIEKLVSELSENLSKPTFKINIEKIDIGAKPVYTTTKTPENFFAIKQLQHNIKRSFKVKQANRFAIINQLNSMLTDNFPKIILRTDIKSFYESIPHDNLLEKINNNPLLSFLSKKIISKILKDFIIVSESNSKLGIPRGIGVSAYLAELYMRDIDKEISTIEDVTYYARYVDDIIIIFTPTSNQKAPTYLNEVKKIIEFKTGLTINSTKTKEIDLVKNNAACELEFLGYLFEFKNLMFQKIKLTRNKVKKYEDKISDTILEFIKQNKYDSKNARRLLIHRLNFLTGNTRLENNKSNVLVGIYYTNNLLSQPLEDLIGLDAFLVNKIDLHIADLDLRKRLKLFSFKKGFEEKRYVNFSSKTKQVTLKEILKAF